MVKLTLFLDDESDVAETATEKDEATRIGAGFSYRIVGTLSGGLLNAKGFVFESELLDSEYGYLDGKRVEVGVTRINLKFLT